MKTHVITTKLQKASKTTKPKPLVMYAGLATLVIVAIFMSLYCYALSALNSALAGFQP